MAKHSKELLAVLHEAQQFAGQLPLKRRASLYRGRAEICADTQERADYLKLASECDALRAHEMKIQCRLQLEETEQ